MCNMFSCYCIEIYIYFHIAGQFLYSSRLKLWLAEKGKKSQQIIN